MNWSLTDNLFGFDRPDSTGQRIFRRAVELFAVFSAVYLAWTWALYTTRLADVVLPLGIARYVDISFLFGPTRAPVLAGGLTVFVVVGYVIRNRWAYAVAFLLLITLYAARFSQGEIPHSANLAGMALLGFALGAAFFQNRLFADRFAVGFSYFSLGLAYASAAWVKLGARGLGWPDGRHLWMWINEKAVDEIARTGTVVLNPVQELALSSHAVATLFLAFGLITEFAAPLVWFRRSRYVVMMLVLGLHIGIYLVMDIIFMLSMIELVLLGLPWAAVIDRAIGSREMPDLTDRPVAQP